MLKDVIVLLILDTLMQKERIVQQLRWHLMLKDSEH